MRTTGRGSSDETALCRTRTARARSSCALWLLLCACNADRAGDHVSDRITTTQLQPPRATAVAEDDPQTTTVDGSTGSAHGSVGLAVKAAAVDLEAALLAPGASDELDAAALADVKAALSAVE